MKWMSEALLATAPRIAGYITHPDYAPDGQREHSAAAWRRWAADNRKEDWPGWLDAWMKTQPTPLSETKPEPLPPSSPPSAECLPTKSDELTPDCLRSWELYAMQLEGGLDSNG